MRCNVLSGENKTRENEKTMEAAVVMAKMSGGTKGKEFHKGEPARAVKDRRNR